MNDFREYSELYHYGIKGMHWGIRRYQNPDGSLTPLGKQHYDEEIDAIHESYRKKIEKSEKRAAKADSYLKLSKEARSEKKTEKMKKKKALSEAEIKTYKDLMKAEEKMIKSLSYKELSDIRRSRQGEALARTILGTVAGQVVPRVLGMPFGWVEFDRADLNMLSSKEREAIIDKDMKKVTDDSFKGRMKRNSMYNRSRRFYNTRSRR